MDRSIGLLLIALLLAGFGLYTGLNGIALLVGFTSPLLMLTFLAQGVLAIAAAYGVARAQPWAAGVLLVAGAAPAGPHVGVRLALAAGTERELPLGTGRVRWRHLVAALGPDGRFPISSTRFGIGLHAEALLSSL